jgi:hypothetical protein
MEKATIYWLIEIDWIDWILVIISSVQNKWWKNLFNVSYKNKKMMKTIQVYAVCSLFLEGQGRKPGRGWTSDSSFFGFILLTNLKWVSFVSQENKSGNQDEEIWKHWTNLFILWKHTWVQEKGYSDNTPIILLLDSHYSHLNLGVPFTVVKNQSHVSCMLAHATHLVKPNDKTINKQFKQNLDEEL